MLADPSLFDAVFVALRDEEPVVRMRAAGALEKITRIRPDLLHPHIDTLLVTATAAEEKEVRWHVAQMLGIGRGSRRRAGGGQGIAAGGRRHDQPMGRDAADGATDRSEAESRVGASHHSSAGVGDRCSRCSRALCQPESHPPSPVRWKQLSADLRRHVAAGAAPVVLHGTVRKQIEGERVSNPTRRGGGDMTTATTVQHLNPEELHQNPAFTNVVTIAANARNVYVGGQNALTAEGEIVGKGDLATQTEQVFHNLETALAAAGARLDDVVKWNIFVVHGQPIYFRVRGVPASMGKEGEPAGDNRRAGIRACQSRSVGRVRCGRGRTGGRVGMNSERRRSHPSRGVGWRIGSVADPVGPQWEIASRFVNE